MSTCKNISLSNIQINISPYIYHINKGSLWNHLIKLTLSNFNTELTPGSLPPRLTYLHLQNYDKELCKGVLPGTLEKLILGHSFNRSLQKIIPANLRELTLGYIFNQSLDDCLPDMLENLELHCCIAPTLNKNTLPKGLKRFLVASEYHHGLEGMLPSGLKQLVLGACHKPIKKGTLPDGLTHLSFINHYDLIYDDIVQQRYYNNIEIGSLPDSLKHLSFEGHVQLDLINGILPLNLEYLKFGGGFGSGYMNDIHPDSLPGNLQHMVLCNSAGEHNFFKYPPSMKTLEISLATGMLYPNLLPDTIEKLILDLPNQDITDGLLPEKLIHLHIITRHIMIEEQALPLTLQYLEMNSFGGCFRLPSNLKHLVCNIVCKGKLPILPTYLQKLTFTVCLEEKKEIKSSGLMIEYTL